MTTPPRAASLLRLNLGCGGDPQPGMINVDAMGEGCQLACDARRLPFEDGSVGHIQALHLVEHLGWVGCSFALCEWFRLLAPGGTLVVETPDLLASARELAASPYPRRALLANWIYGHESPGMQHRFGFELAVLRDLLESCGFTRVRRQRPRSHPGLPGLRVLAERGDQPAQSIHARFKGLLWARGIAPEHQLLAVELHERVAADLVRTFDDTPVPTARAHGLLARLAVYDARVAEAALEAAAQALAPPLRARWRRLLDTAAVRSLPASLSRSLLAEPIRPGEMAKTFHAVRDARVAELGAWAERPGLGGGTRARVDRRRPRDRSPRTRLGQTRQRAEVADVVVRPFSPAGLSIEAERQRARGLRNFVEGELVLARRRLLLSAQLNSNAPTTFWNLARLDLRAGHRARAIEWMGQAICACTPAEQTIAEAIRHEQERVASGKRVDAVAVSPTAWHP